MVNSRSSSNLVSSDRSWGWWLVAGIAAVAFVATPATLAGGGYGGVFDGGVVLQGLVRDGFVQFWQSHGVVSASMADLVGYWTRYHLVKAALALAVLVAATVLGVRSWRMLVRGGPGSTRRGTGTTLVAASALGVGAMMLVMANVQGAIAPLSSVLGLLPPVGRDDELRAARDQVVYQLQAGPDNPALSRMVDDFGRYHAVLAVLAAVAACVAVGIGASVVWSWARTPRSWSSARRARLALAGALVLVATGLLTLMVANAGNASNPAHALLLFYGAQ